MHKQMLKSLLRAIRHIPHQIHIRELVPTRIINTQPICNLRPIRPFRTQFLVQLGQLDIRALTLIFGRFEESLLGLQEAESVTAVYTTRVRMAAALVPIAKELREIDTAEVVLDSVAGH